MQFITMNMSENKVVVLMFLLPPLPSIYLKKVVSARYITLPHQNQTR